MMITRMSCAGKGILLIPLYTIIIRGRAFTVKMVAQTFQVCLVMAMNISNLWKYVINFKFSLACCPDYIFLANMQQI